MDDAKFAQKLINDEKENSEHVMLVDLARNDLSQLKLLYSHLARLILIQKINE